MVLHMGAGVALRNNWLPERQRGPAKELIDLGVRYPDDMSALLLSAASHQVNDLPFDIKALVPMPATATAHSQEPVRRQRASR